MNKNPNMAETLVFEDDDAHIQLIETNTNEVAIITEAKAGLSKSDTAHVVKMPATVMDSLARAWMDYRINDQSLAYQSSILCFRAFDFRNRFENPVATFREALELLQSDRAYIPEYNSSIVCYLTNGSELEIPDHFYVIKEPTFSSQEEAKEWVLKRCQKIKENSAFKIQGIAISNPDLHIEDQINEALTHKTPKIIDASKNDDVCQSVENWLSETIAFQSKR